ncbi:DUF5959 family protein [Streptomyces coelicoflavus]|uniref:DUF5959 family protein n=1 Tax=Streptomyces coelicoflavus TaxID=285562 RepID=UPI00324EDB3C
MSGNPRPDRRRGPDPVDSLFVSGRIHLYLARLESWANVLDRLDAGEDVAWMEMSRGPSICVQLTGECDGRRWS